MSTLVPIYKHAISIKIPIECGAGENNATKGFLSFISKNKFHQLFGLILPSTETYHKVTKLKPINQ